MLFVSIFCSSVGRRAQIVSALFSFFFGSCSQFVLNFFKKFSNVLNFFCQLFSKNFRGFAAHPTKVHHFRHPSTNAFALISINSSHNKHFYVTISYTFDEYSSSNRTQFLKFTRLEQSQMSLHQVCVQIHPHSFHSCFVAEVESPKFQYMHRVLVEVVGKENNLFFQAG